MIFWGMCVTGVSINSQEGQVGVVTASNLPGYQNSTVVVYCYATLCSELNGISIFYM